MPHYYTCTYYANTDDDSDEAVDKRDEDEIDNCVEVTARSLEEAAEVARLVVSDELAGSDWGSVSVIVREFTTHGRLADTRTFELVNTHETLQ